MERKILNRRDFLRLTATAATGALLAACQPQPAEQKATQEVPTEATQEGPAEAGETIELELMWRTDPGEAPAVEQVIALWAQNRSDIVVKMVLAPWDEFEPKLMSLHAGGIAPDVIGLGGTNPYAERFVRGMVLAMEPYLDVDDDLAADLYPVATETVTIEGHLYLMPATICGNGTYYNASLFDEAGLDYPPVEWKGTGWTWDDVIEVAKSLTIDKNGDGKIDQYGFMPAHASPWFYTRLWGQDLVSEEDYASGILHKWQTDIPEVYDACVAGLQARADAIYVHQVTPSPETTAALQEMGSLLKTGAVAMSFEGAWAIMPPLPEQFKFGAGPCPMGTPAKGTGTRGKQQQIDGFEISVQTDHPDAGWEFIKFFVADVEAIRTRLKGFVYLPSVRSGLTAWLDEYSKGLTAMSRDGLEQTLLESLEVAAEEQPFRGTGCACGHLVGWTAARDVFGAELEPVWAGQKSVKEAVDTMLPLVNDAIQKHLEGLDLT